MSDTWDFIRGRADIVAMMNLYRICIRCPTLIFLLTFEVVIFNIFHAPPSFQLKGLYVPTLDIALNSSTNSSIAFDIYLANLAPSSNTYFDPINVTFYDDPMQNHSIASFTIPEFFLKTQGKVEYRGMVNATGLDFDAAKHEIAAKGFKVFSVDLNTSVRYDLYAFWKTARHAYHKSADARIDDTGVYAAQSDNINIFGVLVGSLVLFIIIVILYVSCCFHVIPFFIYRGN